MSSRDIASAVFIWIALPFVGSAWLAYGVRESTIAVIVEPVAPGLILAALGFVMSALGLFMARSRSTTVSRWAGATLSVAAVVAMALLLSFRVSYDSEEVRFEHDGVTLAGTLYRPPGSGPFPAAVLIHGSGPSSRSEYAFYARFLARRGIASLVYDKRGVGESTGALYEADYGDYAEDALAGVRLLARVPEIEPEGIGLIGFSEGEWVAPLAAARSDRVSFVVVIGASGTSPAEQVAVEMAMRLRARGYEAPTVERALALNERLFSYQRTGHGAAQLDSALDVAQGEEWFDAAEDLPREVYPIETYAWWRTVMDFDPGPVWERVDVPVLLLKGGRDDRSPAEPMRREITAALARGGNEDVSVIVFPGGDHMLLEWPMGVGTPPPVFTEGYPQLLVPWIHARTPS